MWFSRDSVRCFCDAWNVPRLLSLYFSVFTLSVVSPVKKYGTVSTSPNVCVLSRTGVYPRTEFVQAAGN